jgi:hypothetical protein
MWPALRPGDRQATHRHPRSLERNSGLRPRLADLEPALGIRWVSDRRTPAFLLQAPMCLRPGWRFVNTSNPMGQRGLIAPLREAGHNAATHARLHKGAHCQKLRASAAGQVDIVGSSLDSLLEGAGFELSVPRESNGEKANEPVSLGERKVPEMSSTGRRLSIFTSGFSRD